jgi:hypothetical protein
MNWAVRIEHQTHLRTAPGSTPCMPRCHESTSCAGTVELAGERYAQTSWVHQTVDGDCFGHAPYMLPRTRFTDQPWMSTTGLRLSFRRRAVLVGFVNMNVITFSRICNPHGCCCTLATLFASVSLLATAGAMKLISHDMCTAPQLSVLLTPSRERHPMSDAGPAWTSFPNVLALC